MFNKHIYTEIEIGAPTYLVWSVLTDTASYPSWNPFIKNMDGFLAKGYKLSVSIQAPGNKPMTFKPTLLTVDKNSELRWLGHFGVPGIFDGEHVFRLEETSGGSTRFIQEEYFKGILIPLFKRMFTSTTQGFSDMNNALKKRAEGINS